MQLPRVFVLAVVAVLVFMLAASLVLDPAQG